MFYLLTNLNIFKLEVANSTKTLKETKRNLKNNIQAFKLYCKFYRFFHIKKNLKYSEHYRYQIKYYFYHYILYIFTVSLNTEVIIYLKFTIKSVKNTTNQFSYEYQIFVVNSSITLKLPPYSLKFWIWYEI